MALTDFRIGRRFTPKKSKICSHGTNEMANGHHVTEKNIPHEGFTPCSKLGDYLIEIYYLSNKETISNFYGATVHQHLIKVLEKYNPPIIDSFLPCSYTNPCILVM